MKKLLVVLFAICSSQYSQAQSAEKTRLFVLEKADATILEGLPKEITMVPVNGTVMLENIEVEDVVFKQQGTKVKFQQSTNLSEETFKYILKILEDGALAGKVKIANKSYALEYAEYIKCQNEDHNPKHLCKVGEDRNLCAEEDCVF